MTALVDENFDEFVSNWTHFKDRLVVFLGAGASMGALNRSGQKLPGAYELRNALWETYKHEGPEPFEPAELKLMSLEHASAIIETKVGRTEVSKFLERSFDCDKPLWNHVALPYLEPKAVFTTNYDELVEKGYKSHPAVIDVICDDRKPVSPHVPIYKPHGSLSHSSEAIGSGGLVITQFDYFEMIATYRKMLEKTIKSFGGKCVLVIGYSFGDMDIGSELYRLRQQTSDTPWYTVFPRNDPLVRKMYSKRLGIEQINRTVEGFLADLDERVDFLPKKYKYDQIAKLRGEDVIQEVEIRRTTRSPYGVRVNSSPKIATLGIALARAMARYIPRVCNGQVALLSLPMTITLSSSHSSMVTTSTRSATAGRPFASRRNGF